MRTMILVLALAAMILLSRSQQAHHSYSAYATDRRVSVEGGIEEVLLQNPHTILILKTSDRKRTPWNGSPSAASGAGVSSITFKGGDHVVVTGSPMKDPAARTISLVKSLHRASAGWSGPQWSRK